MAKELVVYKNEFNTVPLRNFNAVEMDLLFAIMSQMREKGTSEVSFGFDEIKELSQYQPTASDRFVADLERTYDKLIQLDVKVGTSEDWTKFVFFTKYSVSTKNGTISIKVNEEFAHLINELTGNFTKLELEEVTSLRSSYSKTMYRLLRQYRTTGVAIFTMDVFRSLLDIPDSYPMYKVRQAVFGPIKRELEAYFENLKIIEIKGRGKSKRQTIQLEIRFDRHFNTREDKNGITYCSYRAKDGTIYNKKLEELTQEEMNKTFLDCEELKEANVDDEFSAKDAEEVQIAFKKLGDEIGFKEKI